MCHRTRLYGTVRLKLICAQETQNSAQPIWHNIFRPPTNTIQSYGNSMYIGSSVSIFVQYPHFPKTDETHMRVVSLARQIACKYTKLNLFYMHLNVSSSELENVFLNVIMQFCTLLCCSEITLIYGVAYTAMTRAPPRMMYLVCRVYTFCKYIWTDQICRQIENAQRRPIQLVDGGMCNGRLSFNNPTQLRFKYNFALGVQLQLSIRTKAAAVGSFVLRCFCSSYGCRDHNLLHTNRFTGW